MRRILLLLSGGGQRNAAVQAAIEKGISESPTEIVALYVIDAEVPASVSSWLIYVGFMGDRPSDDYHQTILKEYRRRAQEDLSEAAAQIGAAGLACKIRMEEGDLLQTIRRVLNEEQAELMVMALPAKTEVGAALYHDAAKSLLKTKEIKLVLI
jgi:nucleotide-binding universal stress UspA family protein